MTVNFVPKTIDDSNLKQNAIPVKDENGNLVDSGLILQDGIIVSTKDLEIPPNTLHLGDNIELHENGGFIENTTKTLNKRYILLDYETGDSGSLTPVFYKRAAIENTVVIQSSDSTQIDNVTEISLIPSVDSEVSKIYFKLVDAVSNFKIKIEVNTNDVAYYPSKVAWNDNTISGYNLESGTVNISLDPHFSFLTSYNIKFHIKADSAINLLGNGTTPWFAVDRQRILRLDVVTEDKQIVSNMLYANDNKTDIQTMIDSTAGNTAIAISPGSYGGSDVTINNKTQLTLVALPAGGTTCTELLNRGVNITGCSRIRISNLQIEGLVNISGGTGNHYFRDTDFVGGLHVGNESNAIIITDCDFTENIIIDNTFTGIVYFVMCNFGGVTLTNNATSAQVIITQCTNLPLTLANVYLGGLNSFTNLASRLDVTTIYINGTNITDIFQPKQ